MSIIQAALTLACVVSPIMFHFRQGRQVLLHKKFLIRDIIWFGPFTRILPFDHESAGSGYEILLNHVVHERYDAQKLLNGNIS